MSGTTIKSIFVKTGPSQSVDDENLGYELLKVKDDFTTPIIHQPSISTNINIRRHTFVSSENVFPNDVQATMKPYFERTNFSHELNPNTTDTVDEEEVRVLIETPNDGDYHVQKLSEDAYYGSKDGKPVIPPAGVVKEAQTVFPDYQP